MKISRIINAACALTLLVAFSACSTVSAAPAVLNLTTSPINATLTAKPGQAVTTVLRVQNSGSKPVKLKVQLKKFQAYGSTGEARITDPLPNDPSAKWVSFSETTVLAQPEVWNNITMTIKPPTTAAFGYFYAVLFTDANSGAPATSIRANNVRGSSAILVLLDVQAPGERRQLTVEKLATTKKVYEYLPATFEVTVHNDGNTYVAPQGDIYVSKNSSQNLATVPLNSAQSNVLPGSSRTFEATWEDGFPAFRPKRINGQVVSDKNSQPQRSLSFSGSDISKFRLGRYTAHLTLVYNNGSQDVPVEGEVSFWVIPWKAILVLLLVVLLILTGPALLLRRLLLRHRKATVVIAKPARRPSKKS